MYGRKFWAAMEYQFFISVVLLDKNCFGYVSRIDYPSAIQLYKILSERLLNRMSFQQSNMNAQQQMMPMLLRKFTRQNNSKYINTHIWWWRHIIFVFICVVVLWNPIIEYRIHVLSRCESRFENASVSHFVKINIMNSSFFFCINSFEKEKNRN